jgi:serine/threonine protein kinase
MLNPGAVLQNRYEIVEPVGKGGMGAVYLAKDTRLGHLVALKETFFQEESMRRAFEREARLLAGLSHPALPRVTDHFTENEGQFLVMEYISGDDLEKLLRRRNAPFPLSQVSAWAEQLFEALAYLHNQNPPVVHRDIKPQNIKLTTDNRVVLLDFGLAKGQAADMTQTSGKSIFGYTAAYAPLEQIRGIGTDPRSDLYSLGATLFHLLTATPPADAITRANAIIGGQPDPLPLASNYNPELSDALAQALQRATALHAGQRFADAPDFRRAWQYALAGAAAPGYATAPIAGSPTLPRETNDFATTPVRPEISEVATQILPGRESLREKDYSTKAITVQAPANPRWRYAAGGLLAATALGAALWATNGGWQAPANQPPALGNGTPAVNESGPLAVPSPSVNVNAAPTTSGAAQNPAKPAPAKEQKVEKAVKPNNNPVTPPPAPDAPNPPKPAARAGAHDANTHQDPDYKGLDEDTRREIEEAKREGEEARRAGGKAQAEGERMRRRILSEMQRKRRRQANANPPRDP